MLWPATDREMIQHLKTIGIDDRDTAGTVIGDIDPWQSTGTFGAYLSSRCLAVDIFKMGRCEHACGAGLRLCPGEGRLAKEKERECDGPHGFAGAQAQLGHLQPEHGNHR